MCGRYTLTSEEGIARELELAVAEPAEPSEWWRPRFNIAPTQPAPVVLEKDGERRLEMMRWGLVPHWAESLAVGARMINARVETIEGKPAFRDAIRRRRCLVPADGFFEWRLRGSGRSSKKIPIYMRPVPRRVVAFAGLWERWKAPDGIWVTSFAIITGPPNALAGRFHDRMPVWIEHAHYAPWLAAGELPPALIEEILRVPPVADWEAVEVSPKASSPHFDEPECVEPVAAVEPEPEQPAKAAKPDKPDRQLKLF
jgi:putative SOS response-associated peptidase YedK